mgnify:CR=1 FL=1
MRRPVEGVQTRAREARPRAQDHLHALGVARRVEAPDPCEAERPAIAGAAILHRPEQGTVPGDDAAAGGGVGGAVCCRSSP